MTVVGIKSATVTTIGNYINIPSAAPGRLVILITPGTPTVSWLRHMGHGVWFGTIPNDTREIPLRGVQLDQDDPYAYTAATLITVDWTLTGYTPQISVQLAPLGTTTTIRSRMAGIHIGAVLAEGVGPTDLMTQITSSVETSGDTTARYSTSPVLESSWAITAKNLNWTISTSMGVYLYGVLVALWGSPWTTPVWPDDTNLKLDASMNLGVSSSLQAWSLVDLLDVVVDDDIDEIGPYATVTVPKSGPFSLGDVVDVSVSRPPYIYHLVRGRLYEVGNGWPITMRIFSWPADLAGYLMDSGHYLHTPGGERAAMRLQRMIWRAGANIPVREDRVVYISNATTTRQGRLLDALREVADSTAGKLRYVYDYSAEDYMLVYADLAPPTTASATIPGKSYLSVNVRPASIADVRNRVVLEYGPTNARATTQLQDTASINAYGRRDVYISLAEMSTLESAQALGAQILRDLAEPAPIAEITIPIRPLIQPGDTVVLEAFPPYLRADAQGTVLSVQHRISHSEARTRLTVRLAPTAQYRRWLGR